jgi:predicted enzyme related to lactoylglutathione lyase
MRNQVMLKLVFGILLWSLTNVTIAQNQEINSNQNVVPMKSYVSIFEIPALDIERAISFYESILNVEIELMDLEYMKIGVLPYEDQIVNGVIIQSEGMKPSANGVTIYLDAGEDLQPVLDKVSENGGQIVEPKTQHADESGFFAIFLDSEGNRMGLHSRN